MYEWIKTMRMLLLALMLIALIAMPPPAGAVPTGATITNVSNTTYTQAVTPEGVSATGGNITNVDFNDILSVTSKWQGYVGNVSGKIFLANAAGDSMYNWTVSAAAGQIYATQDSTMNITKWENLAARTGANIDADFVFNASDSDSGTNTFNQDPASINVSGRTINGGANTATLTYNLTDIGTWTTIALADSTSPAESNYVFAGVMINNGESYDGSQKDFQMIVPENEATNGEVYYFYVELT